MGKSLKKKSSDFQKVKLKVGKKKPVGQNVTKTTFRTSTIQISNQLEEKDEPTNKRNLSLKELLIQVNHYNVTVRHEALVGIKNLFVKHPNVMHNQIGVWVPKVLDKLTDVDAAVRHSLQLCVCYALHQMDENEIKPFLKILVAYICSGMTHINEGVQLDALNILEVVISRFPSIFQQHAQKVLTNFMDLLVKQTSKETSTSQTLKGSKIKGGFSILNVEGKLSSLKTRCKILEKLCKILEVVKEHRYNSKQEETEIYSSTVLVENNKETFIPIYKFSLDPPDLSQTKNLEDWLSSDLSQGTLLHDDFETFSEMLFKVLINIWVEHEPGQLAAALVGSNSLRSIIPGMRTIVDIIDILIELTVDEYELKNKRFILTQQVWYKDFSAHFLRYFTLPIDFAKPSSPVKSIKQGKANDMQLFALAFNFVSARVLINSFTSRNVIAKTDSKLFKQHMKQLKQFFFQSLESAAMLSVEQIDELMSVIQFMVRLRLSATLTPADFQSDMIDIPSLLKKLTYVFSRASVVSPWKIPLIKVFSDFINHYRYNSNLQEQTWEEVRSFIHCVVSVVWSLPSTSTALLKICVEFIKQIIVQRFVDKKMETLIESNLIKMTDGSKCLFVELPPGTQRLVVEVIFNLNHLSEQLVQNITFTTHHPNVSTATKKYIISTLQDCLSKPEPSLSRETYISVVLSVVLGYSVKDLRKLNSGYSNAVSWSMLNVYQDEPKDIPFEYAIDQLKQMDGCESFWSVVITIIGKFLVMFRSLPVTPAVGLVKLLERLSEWSNESKKEGAQIESEINQMADLISAVLLYSVSKTYQSISSTSITKTSAKHDEQLEDDVISSCINLLAQNDILLKQLLKKWINILGEYKMNWTCVSSLVEVIIALLYDPNLQLKMAAYKQNLKSITKAFTNVSVPIKERNLLRELEVQISVL